ncbi:hypothetical protein FRC09_020668 [Ceratobasidium sp. 395]|nr:hypothetical protein FRC09_020668 [Ceratobasidium sp. 395]
MKVMYAVSFKNAVPDRPKRLEVGSSRYNEWWLLLSQCWSRQPETRPKAADWKTLDSSLSMQRTQQLSEQLAFALCYGRTMSGPLKNLDTGEELPPNISTATLPVFELVDSSSLETQMQSKEALLKALIDLRTSATVTRNAYLDVSYVQNLQYSIYRDLEERIQRVRYWTTINTAHFSQKNQNRLKCKQQLASARLSAQAAPCSVSVYMAM